MHTHPWGIDLILHFYHLTKLLLHCQWMFLIGTKPSTYCVYATCNCNQTCASNRQKLKNIGPE